MEGCQLRGILPTAWKWSTVIATSWQKSGEHINVYELRAYLLALRWRTRFWHNIGTRFLHLVDSQVTKGVCTKGRTSSLRLQRVLSKVNAYIWAAHIFPVIAFCRSHLNPADGPSRKRRKEQEDQRTYVNSWPTGQREQFTSVSS